MHEVKIELGNRSELLIQPRERWVLWHITANCNIECDYCYGSFDGGSYKRDWVPGLELGTSRALAVASEIAAAGFDGVHINGGEPLLRDDCLPVAAKCAEAGLRTWLLTNGTVKARDVDRIASGDLGIEMLAFSFDSVDSSIADSQREKSRAARNTIERVTANASGAGPSVGVYVVLTAASLPGFPALVTWLRDIGVDYVNVQPCYLPESHPDGDRLGLRDEHRTAVVDAYAMLREMVPASTTAGMADLAAAAVGLRGIAHDCFADIGDYAYISPSGAVLGCPSKPGDVVISSGSLTRESFSDIATRMARTRGKCPHLTTDCLGMYEMALGPGRPAKDE